MCSHFVDQTLIISKITRGNLTRGCRDELQDKKVYSSCYPGN